MSTRTIIEINHDRLDDLTAANFQQLVEGLKGCVYNAALNLGETPAAAPGIRVLGQRHHTTTLKLVVR